MGVGGADGSVNLSYYLSVTLPALSVNETGLSLPIIRIVPNIEFQTVWEDKHGAGESTVGNFGQSVCKCS